MAKTTELAKAPISKYAARKQNANKVNDLSDLKDVIVDVDKVADVKEEKVKSEPTKVKSDTVKETKSVKPTKEEVDTKVEQLVKEGVIESNVVDVVDKNILPVEGEVKTEPAKHVSVNTTPIHRASTTHIEKKKVHKSKKAQLPDTSNNYPKHIVDVAIIIKNNAEIRRFTALGIINYLLQKGEIRGINRYVSFKWNMFVVTCDGLRREYSYTEPFFLNCLVASFASFSSSAQKTIDTFTRQEVSMSINEAVNMEDVNEIDEMNSNHVANSK